MERLSAQVITAFPDLLTQMEETNYTTQYQWLEHLIESRFIYHFLTFLGFVIAVLVRFINDKKYRQADNITSVFTNA